MSGPIGPTPWVACSWCEEAAPLVAVEAKVVVEVLSSGVEVMREKERAWVLPDGWLVADAGTKVARSACGPDCEEKVRLVPRFLEGSTATFEGVRQAIRSALGDV